MVFPPFVKPTFAQSCRADRAQWNGMFVGWPPQWAMALGGGQRVEREAGQGTKNGGPSLHCWHVTPQCTFQTLIALVVD